MVEAILEWLKRLPGVMFFLVDWDFLYLGGGVEG